MDTVRPAHNTKDRRRSTRVAHAVFLTVSGVDGAGRPFVEKTGTLELSLHGCRYFSKYEVRKNSCLVLEIPNQQAGSHPHSVRGRVVWVRKSRKLSGLFQVGVELEAPGNVWALANPPEDWQQPTAPRESDAPAFERELEELLAQAEKGTYYDLLRVTSNSPSSQIKRNYYELVRKFHPDRHMARPEWTQPLHKLMDTITLAYKILADETARKEYDQRLAESGTFTLGGHKSDLQKTAGECLVRAHECLRAQNYGGSILWLREAVHIEPESSKYHALLARSLSAVPQYRPEAIEHFQQAIELDPFNTALHFQLAALCEEMKLPWQARAHYQRILEILPEDKKAQERLHLLDAAAGRKGAGKRTLIDRLFTHCFK